MPLNNAPNSCAVISRRVLVLAERHRVRSFFQPLGPYREPVAIPIQYFDPVATAVGEHEQMPGESIELHLPHHQCVQPVEAPPHIARRGAKYTRTLAGRWIIAARAVH